MNWLFIGLPLALVYIGWFTFLLTRKNTNRSKGLTWFGLAHLIYPFLNLVAPFRGPLDPGYVGYNIGWIHVPQGFMVTVVAGGIAAGCLLIATRALQNRMDKLWFFTLAFDLFLAVMIAIPVLLDILGDPEGFRLELGEYLQVSGYFVAFVIFMILTLPGLFTVYYSAKTIFRRRLALA